MSFDLLSFDHWGTHADLYVLRFGRRALFHLERWMQDGTMRTRIGSVLWIKPHAD